ncbi:MAG: hypothetical protein WC931_04150, partial [Bacilli bacterium]
MSTKNRTRALARAMIACSLFAIVLLPVAVSAAPGSFSLVSPTNGACTKATPYFSWGTSSGASTYTLAVQPTIGSTVTQTGITTTHYTLTSGQALSAAGNVHLWDVTAYNTASESTSSSTMAFYVDATAPAAFGLTSPADGSWSQSADVIFSWEGSSDTGCAGFRRYRLYIDGTLCADNLTTTSIALSAISCSPVEGAHVWRVSAEDTVGNITWCSQSPGGSGGWTINLDNSGPGYIWSYSTTVSSGNYANGHALGWASGPMVTAGDTIAVTASGTLCDGVWCTSDHCRGPDGSLTRWDVDIDDRVYDECDYGELIGRIGSSGSIQCLGSALTFVADQTGTLTFASNWDPTFSSYCATATVNVTVHAVSGTWSLLTPTAGQLLGTSAPTFSWV